MQNFKDDNIASIIKHYILKLKAGYHRLLFWTYTLVRHFIIQLPEKRSMTLQLVMPKKLLRKYKVVKWIHSDVGSQNQKYPSKFGLYGTK